MNKINLKEVFKNAAELYREQWRLLLKLSGIQSVLAYVMVLSSLVLNYIPQDNLALLMIATLFRLLISLFGTYFLVRVFVSTVLATKHEYNGSHGTVGSYYRMAEPVTWRCIGYRLLIGLMYIIPACFIAIALVLPMIDGYNIPIRSSVIFFIIGAIPIIILAVLFYYAVTTAIVYRYPKSILGYSVKLLKGNVLNVFILVLIAGIQIVYNFSFAYFLGVDKFSFGAQAGFYLLQQIPVWFATPFLISLTVISMQMIEEKYFGVREETKVF